MAARGIFVEGLSETPILSAEAALQLVEKAQVRRRTHVVVADRHRQDVCIGRTATLDRTGMA